jgi:DNA-binding transcriptional MerR regulator
MRDTTQAHIRNQGVAIAEVRGALQALAEPTAWATKQYLQQRIAIMEDRLAKIQTSLNEIEFSESIEWLEDKAGVDA